MASKYMTGEPYKLQGHRIAFTNWQFVRPGCFAWFDKNDNIVPLSGDICPEDAVFKGLDLPFGIKLKAEKALMPDEPILIPDSSFEKFVDIYTVINVDSVFRAWGTCTLQDGNVFSSYYESDDGWHWKRPDVGIIEYKGKRSNNFIESIQGTVFCDSSGMVQEKYKAIGEFLFTEDDFEKYCQKRPGDFDPISLRYDLKEKGDAAWICGARGWVSPDGFRWNAIDMPLVVTHTDTQIVCYYDIFLKKYVAYFRDWNAVPRAESYHNPDKLPWKRAGRRSIGRAETDNFRAFPLPELMLEPGPDISPTEVLYTNCKTNFPGTYNQHLIFPTIWNMADDTTTVRVASSSNGKVWHFLSSNPVFKTAGFGKWNGGAIFSHPNLLELPDGNFVLPYTGYDVPHKYPRGQWRYAVGYSMWPKGRLVALEAQEKGEFATIAVIPPSEKITLNAVTKRAGFIQVEAARLNGTPIQGREFSNSVPCVGDCYKKLVVWKSHDNLGLDKNEPVILRFRLNKAAISFERQ